MYHIGSCFERFVAHFTHLCYKALCTLSLVLKFFFNNNFRNFLIFLLADFFSSFENFNFRHSTLSSILLRSLSSNGK